MGCLGGYAILWPAATPPSGYATALYIIFNFSEEYLRNSCYFTLANVFAYCTYFMIVFIQNRNVSYNIANSQAIAKYDQ